MTENKTIFEVEEKMESVVETTYIVDRDLDDEQPEEIVTPERWD